MTATLQRPRTVAPPKAGPIDRERVEQAFLRVLRMAGIAFFALVTVFPFYYMVLLSVRPLQNVLQSPTSLLPSPHELTFGSYLSVLKPTGQGGQGFLLFLRNSALVGVASVVLTILIALPGAYAVSRITFTGKRAINFLFLSVYILPTIMLAIPLFVFLSVIGLRGSLVSLVFVYVAQTLPVAVYMLRNYLEAIPTSMEEAAFLDGCGRLGVIFRVIVPLAGPAILATAVYVFMIAWNEYLFALLFLVDKRQSWTVSLGVAQLVNIEIPTTVLMAGSVILTIPIVVLFFFTQRRLVAGLTDGAVKS